MTNKVLGYGIVGLLALALLVGTGYILLKPTEAQAERGYISGQGQGQGRRNAGGGAKSPDPAAYDGIVSTPVESGGYRTGGSRGDGAGASDGRGQSSGAGQGRNQTARIVEWETLTGKVTAVDGEAIVQTAGGEVLVGMGQAAYREGFALDAGDSVSVTGFYEDGEFKAGAVENLTTGETIVLRDETGRPVWAGQGRLKNRD
jgi:hypothetical protein